MTGVAFSSSLIVPVAVLVPSVALVGFERVAVMVSLPSRFVSPHIATVNVFVVSPAAKFRVPLEAV